MALTAAPLQPGVFQFFDDSGAPLKAGLLYTWEPNSTTPKDTWQDDGQAALNANPITLDAGGRCVMFGAGAYRLQLFDQTGALVWDNVGEAADLDTIAANLPVFTPDTGTGGAQGLVPAPPAGSAAAGQYLGADGTWDALNVVIPAAPAENQAGLLMAPISNMTALTRTLQLSDIGSWIQYSNSGAGTLTIPTDAVGAWVQNVVSEIVIHTALASGGLTITPAAGVNLFWPGSSVTPGARTVAANGQVVLSYLNNSTWTIAGAGIS